MFQHKCHGESNVGQFRAEQLANQPKVHQIYNREFVVEYHGEFKRYRDGKEVRDDAVPKG
jgi:hypothetical protein